VNAGDSKTVWVTSGLLSLPVTVAQATQGQEQSLCAALSSELRSGLAINVEPEPVFDRIQESQGGGGEGRLLVVGSRNARNLQIAMHEAGIEADLIFVNNLRII
jgi:hypothetical protein